MDACCDYPSGNGPRGVPSCIFVSMSSHFLHFVILIIRAIPLPPSLPVSSSWSLDVFLDTSLWGSLERRCTGSSHLHQPMPRVRILALVIVVCWEAISLFCPWRLWRLLEVSLSFVHVVTPFNFLRHALPRRIIHFHRPMRSHHES